jgi:hypothetical protein
MTHVIVTHQGDFVVRLQHDVHMTFFMRQLCNVNKARAHPSFVGLDNFLNRLLANALLNYRGAELSLRGHIRDTLKELFLRLQSLVALSLAQLLESISNDNFVRRFQPCLRASEEEVLPDIIA